MRMRLKDYLYQVKKRIKKSLDSVKNVQELKRYIKYPIGKKIYFIGTPEYTNLGDSAIAIAQMLFLEKCGYPRKNIKEFTQSDYIQNSVIINKYINKRYLICGIGGGNLGNQWYNEELFRYSFIDAFPDNPIISFPQTVFFTDDEEGRLAIEESKKHYDAHNNLTIIAREKKSYKLLNDLYHHPTKLLTPDIVLSTTMGDYGVTVNNRSGGLLVLRNDVEKQMSDSDREEIIRSLNENGIAFRVTDMDSNEPVTKENRKDLVRKKLQEFADAEFVITDRLHGMVFAAITETPCIVFSNYNQKVKGTYEWISCLPYIKYARDVRDSLSVLQELFTMNCCRFDNKPLIRKYDDLIKEIQKYVN